jgi:hypothetical protein
MGRNYLTGRDGDRINAVLAASGYNFGLLLRWFEELLRVLSLILCHALLAAPLHLAGAAKLSSRPTTSAADKIDQDFSDHDYLAVPLDQVKDNFRKFDLPGDNVKFIKGWFSRTFFAIYNKRGTCEQWIKEGIRRYIKPYTRWMSDDLLTEDEMARVTVELGPIGLLLLSPTIPR